MSEDKKTSSGSGCCFGTIATTATTVLAVLKIVGLIECSWWVVFLPILASAGLTIGFVILVALVAAVTEVQS